LRAYYQFEPRSALRLFRSAIREDTSFAMAYYYAWRAAAGIADPETQDLGMSAIELAARAGPRDRLLILTHLGAASSDPRALAAAETLATNYPNDPEALVRAGEVARDVSQATRLLNQSIAIDSAAGVVPKSICRMCFALSSLAGRYAWEDSLGAAITTMRRWIRLRPGDGIAWCGLADYMTADGNRAAADSATRRCDAAGGFGANQHLAQLVSMLRFEDVAAANRECRDGLATMDLPAYEQYRWYCTIALRMQGRMREAQLLARQGRSGVFGLRVAPHGFNGPSVINEPILLTETGNPAAAVPMFRRMYPETYAPNKRLPEGTVARNATWTMTLAATAAADAGDTVLARAYVDSIANMGQRSLFPRDPMLHHFVRGLLHARAGQLEQAVTEYRRAIVSPAYGYTRMNVELARTLLALNRPMEGIPVIRAALHGGIEGSNLYVTRTELHEVLAQLHAAAGQRDSAAVHYAFVERAWRSADPQYRSRYEAARAAVSVAATR
jgi:tetratricopeptide (TPR) repeat protein